MDIWGPRSEFLSNPHQNWHSMRFYALTDDATRIFCQHQHEGQKQGEGLPGGGGALFRHFGTCLLYTSDAADE